MQHHVCMGVYVADCFVCDTALIKIMMKRSVVIRRLMIATMTINGNVNDIKWQAYASLLLDLYFNKKSNSYH